MTNYVTVAPDDRSEARSGTIKLHGPEAFAGMRAAGRLAAEILDALVPHVVPGVTTAELDDFIRQFMLDAGARPATLGSATASRGRTVAAWDMSGDFLGCAPLGGKRGFHVLKRGDQYGLSGRIEAGRDGFKDRGAVLGDLR